ncbi:MAG: HAMP domain-containing protein [Planctomycetes bacterium]|nr:HAMP domain-containing protein [Planctomycetota bacterium]
MTSPTGARIDRSLVGSLGFRLLLPLFLTIGAVLTGYAALSFDSTRSHVMRLVRSEIQRSSGLIQQATHDGMLLNRLDEVQTTIERLSGAPDLAAIRIYDKAGEIVISADRAEIGSRIEVAEEPCLSCHGDGEPLTRAKLEEIRLATRGSDREVLRHLTVIANAPSCAAFGCHSSPEEEKALGVLDVEMSMAPIDATIASARSQLAWATVVLVLIVVASTTMLIRRLVQRPVETLYRATQRIATGDLDTRIEVTGRHEIARLGEAFNRMAEDLQRAHDDLQGWSRKLEAKVVEKTDELRRAQRHVLHSEKMASLGRLCATVAHEINNPLSGVLTYARLVERSIAAQPIERATGQELGRYLGLIQRECARCGDIVKNLLLFARQKGASLAPIDVNTVIDRSLMLVRHHLEMGGVRIHNEPLAGDAEIVADAGQLQQALMDMFVNAAEAMSGPGQEGGDLTVRTTGDRDAVQIDISDTGVGIPPDVLPHVFEPFFSTKGDTSGVGLGLAVVYGIVRGHGGSIEIESEPGRGTTFHVRLPRRPGPRPEEA